MTNENEHIANFESKNLLESISLNYQRTSLLSLEKQDSLSLLDNNEIIEKQQLLQCTRTDSFALTKSDTNDDSTPHEDVEGVDADIYLRNSVYSSDLVSQKSSKDVIRYDEFDDFTQNDQV